MRIFKDKHGREWQLVIDLPNAKRVRDLIKVDLLKTDHLALLADQITLVDVLYGLCRRQAEERKLSDEDFALALSSGEVIEEASNAFMEELIDFFPPSRRSLARQSMGKLREMDSKVLAVVQHQVETMDVDALLNKAMEEMTKGLSPSIGGSTATNSAASSASIPSPLV